MRWTAPSVAAGAWLLLLVPPGAEGQTAPGHWQINSGGSTCVISGDCVQDKSGDYGDFKAQCRNSRPVC